MPSGVAAKETDVLIQFKKGRDSRPTLTCVRNDGSRTWSQVHPFFPEHDMTHLAVERALGLREAFFGLVARGWSLDRFAEPGMSRQLPAEAMLAEHLVGLLDRERAAGTRRMAIEVTDELQASLPAVGRAITEDQLEQIRGDRAEMLAAWQALPAGSTLEFEYSP
ncbi:MAG TPA: hypothetical protein VID74_02260 [Gemmatimonadales bacterium]